MWGLSSLLGRGGENPPDARAPSGEKKKKERLLDIQNLQMGLASLGTVNKAIDYLSQKMMAKSEVEVLLREYTEITKCLLDHSDKLKPEIDKFVKHFESSTSEMERDIDEIMTIGAAIDKTLIPSCERSVQDSKVGIYVERALEDAEKQVLRSEEMAEKRRKFLEESNLHLKNIAQQLREMERKGKLEIDLHHQKLLLTSS
mmetsp:Transcript_28857/g.70361  ORF Transcript_28857/g.70361 Transcript_28857/m.70361 type:complete len:201 (-) Transcript_28857:197-799(-)|eukprot:CAMPEP_0114511946 /NCGR_PEP_ID=MMETSP0109-20121206/14690_1 /TAXON_ID=29199 /ORGANISM="Chlorarachnion reptans, Strain CCCM449" /LENGTH=200 /DNA_ID=CAMNT_0001691551 /DNA_START=57 /DNA_END=659 /DNA_ORIENTATION=-